MSAWRAQSRALTGGLLLLVVSASGVYARTVVASHATWRAASPSDVPTREVMTDQDAADRAALAFPERIERDVQIRVWNEALAADPTSALVLGQLAALHAQRAREGGGATDVQRAEEYARASLAHRTQRNGSTAVTLVNLLLAQHRYTEAFQEAQALQVREADVPQYRALLGEVAMEIGAYDIATVMFDSSFAAGGHLSAAPRIARWYELQGHVRAAREVMVRARVDARSRGDVTRESKAWFSLRLADLELRAGRPRAAARVLREALLEEPNDPRLLAAIAVAAAAGTEGPAVVHFKTGRVAGRAVSSSRCPQHRFRDGAASGGGDRGARTRRQPRFSQIRRTQRSQLRGSRGTRPEPRRRGTGRPRRGRTSIFPVVARV